MRRFFRKSRETSGAEARLDRAVEEWRASQATPTAQDRFSDAGRTRVLNLILSQSHAPEAPLAALFPATGRLVLAAVLPAMLLAVALGFWARQLPDDGPGARLMADKRGDEVIFVIANGQRTHNVYRASRPEGLVETEPFRTADGSFRDRLHSDSNLVYYRID